MTLKASFVFKNPDSTRDLNARLRRVINRGIVWGGTMTPGVGLTVQVTPLVAVGFDGMTVKEDQVKTLVVAGGGVKQYVVVHARYNEGGAPALPVLNWRVLTSAAYLANPEKDYLIVVGTVTPAGPAVIPGELDFTERDEVNPLGRDWYRGVVANPAGLPPAPSPANPATNRVGDFYFVISDQTFHFWTGAAWEPLNTGSYNTETFVMNNVLANLEHVRFVEGSGVIAGIRPNPQGDFASDTEINFIETPTVVNQIGIDGFTAYVNGHRIQTHGQYLTLSPPPFTGWRYDLVFLEVWREDVLIPESFNYGRNPAGLSTLTLQEIADKGEQLEWRAGIPAFPVADNFNLNPVEPYAHNWRVVKWRLGFKTSVPLNTCLYNPSDPAVTITCINIDSNPFSSQPAGTGTDDRLWWAPSTTAADGYSWAIPLFVIRRVAGETPPNAIQMFRDGVRHVFPVYPVADSAHAARKALDTVYRSEPTPFMLDHYPYDEPSGFLSGMDFQIETKAGVNNVAVYEDQAHVRVRGIEDWLDLAAGPNVPLPAPPDVVNGWVRQLVYLRMNITLYDNGSGTATARQYISKRHRPYIPSSLTGDVRAQGWKRGYVTFEYVVHEFGPLDVLDEHDSMVAAGWTRGDLTMASKNAQYEDGGVWSRAIAIDADDRVHPYETEWAIPICLIHRRNTQAWHYNTNPNGSTGRPDGMTVAGHSYPDDLVDLRHEVGVDVADLERRLYSDFDKNMKGQLRTRMANKYRGGGTGGMVAGSRILQSDSIGGLAGTFRLTDADGVRGIWSDAKEFFPVSVSFNLLASSSGPLYAYTYNPPPVNTGVLKIRAPGFAGAPPTAYASIVRHIPTALYLDTSGATQLDYLGPPCWTTQLDVFTQGMTPHSCSSRYVQFSATPPQYTAPIVFKHYIDPTSSLQGESFAVTSTNSIGKAIEMEAHLIPPIGAPAAATLSFWVHFDRSFAGEHAINYGLAEVPDMVWSVVKDPNGAAESINLGPIYTVVRKTVVGSDFVTITSSDVSTASGFPGVVTLCWVDPKTARYSSAHLETISLITMNNDRDTITVTYSGAITTNVDFIVFFSTDVVSKWVEIGRGGKSVQALFSWEDSGQVDLGASPPSTWAWGLGNKTWRTPNVGGNQIGDTFMWARSTSGSGDWLADIGAPTAVGYENSNLFTSKFGLLRYVLVILPVLTPLTSAASDNILINYTYTPYQGVSSTGGAPANPVSASHKLKQLLHGTIEKNTDFVVTQSGACSYYSGVDVWSGYSPNFSYMSSVSGFSGLTTGLFEDYVNTSLVKPTTHNTGTQDSIITSVYASSINSAAVYRLPYPASPLMVGGSSGVHPTGCMDFDLDPGRVGAGSGYRAYAPSYALTPTRYHQFVNSLTLLSTKGIQAGRNTSVSIPASQYQPTSSNQSDYYYLSSFWRADFGVLRMQVDFSTFCHAGETIKEIRTYVRSPSPMLGVVGGEPLTRCALITEGVLISVPGLELNTARKANYTSSWKLFGPTPQYFYFVIYPGVLMEKICTQRGNVGALVCLRTKSGASDVAEIHHTSIIKEPEPTLYGSTIDHQGKVWDTIMSDFGSYSIKRGERLSFTSSPMLSSSICTLEKVKVNYPNDWSLSTVSVVDSLYQASSDHLGHGRGLYIGSPERRYNMPVLVPGSGTSLDELSKDLSVQIDLGASSPEHIPYVPADPLFSSSYKIYHENDHGGPLAYCGFGVAMRPSSDEYKNQVVMQISGGPTGGTQSGRFTPNDLAGTAIDAFWPTGRPVLKSRK